MQHPMNSRLRAVLVVLLVWAVIYLPALGSLAIKGEEGRRILPAIGMLKSGNYIVPEVGGNPYFRKPPLVNWLVAASFAVSSVRNEWTARLPSALAVLAVAIAFVTVARASLGPTGSLIAALIWMTNIGMIEKGRLIEIEALYVSLCGLATIFWLSCWVQKKSPWLIRIPPSIFLGLGLLAKGPTHLVFIYAVVVAVLWRAIDWRLLLHPAHFAALAMIYAGNALQWPRTWTKNDRGWSKVVATFVGIGLAIGVIGYPLTAVVLKNRQQVKKAAAEINAHVPANETLYAVNPDYQPVFFYVKAPVKYVSSVKNLPVDARYFLV